MSDTQPAFLYVEDDPPSRKVMEILLKTVMGYPTLFIMEDSHNFLDRVRALPTTPTIVLLDIQMGPIDGFEMLRLLRAEASFAQAKVIAMTANVMGHDIERLKLAGFNGLIGKPLVREVFPDLMGRILKDEPIWYVP